MEAPRQESIVVCLVPAIHSTLGNQGVDEVIVQHSQFIVSPYIVFSEMFVPFLLEGEGGALVVKDLSHR